MERMFSKDIKCETIHRARLLKLSLAGVALFFLSCAEMPIFREEVFYPQTKQPAVTIKLLKTKKSLTVSSSGSFVIRCLPREGEPSTYYASAEMLVKLLTDRSAHQIVYSNLAKSVRVSVDTVRRWIDVLNSLHLGFLIRPWFKNVSRSLRKEPKWFLRDWAGIEDAGDRAETFVGCHLLKAVDGWNDMGLGMFQLAYMRDKQQREVDFVIVRDGQPWFLVEVKLQDETLSSALKHYQQQTKAPFAFQVVIEADYVSADCFAKPRSPIVVPARTFLSQLL